MLDDQLVDYGCRVMNHRLDFIKKLESFGRKKHFELSNQIEELSISYQSSVNITDKQNLSESFKIALEKVDPEIYLKRILVSVLIEMTFLLYKWDGC